jgi:hypothetical protein
MPKSGFTFDMSHIFFIRVVPFELRKSGCIVQAAVKHRHDHAFARKSVFGICIGVLNVVIHACVRECKRKNNYGHQDRGNATTSMMSQIFFHRAPQECQPAWNEAIAQLSLTTWLDGTARKFSFFFRGKARLVHRLPALIYRKWNCNNSS